MPKKNDLKALKDELRKRTEKKEEEPEEEDKKIDIEEIIKDIYQNIIGLVEEVKRIDTQLNTLRLNQLWIQKFVENQLKERRLPPPPKL